MLMGMKEDEPWAESQPPAFLLDRHTPGIQVYLDEQGARHWQEGAKGSEFITQKHHNQVLVSLLPVNWLSSMASYTDGWGYSLRWFLFGLLIYFPLKKIVFILINKRNHLKWKNRKPEERYGGVTSLCSSFIYKPLLDTGPPKHTVNLWNISFPIFRSEPITQTHYMVFLGLLLVNRDTGRWL